MGCLKNVFKGFKRRSSERIRTSDDDSLPNQAVPSLDPLPKCSEDREEEQRKKKAADAANLEEDEQLARALQKSLNSESPRENGICQPTPYQLSLDFRICAGCNTEIGRHGFVSFRTDVWHPECLLCLVCKQPIDDYEFADSVNSPCHLSCYMKHYAPVCHVCKQFIPIDTFRRQPYRVHSFWKQKCCYSHAFDGTPMCYNCDRREPIGTKYVTLDDGRKICLECLDSAIMDTSECQPLYTQIQEFFASLNMKIEQQIPFALVERQALNEVKEGEEHECFGLKRIKGVCLSRRISGKGIGTVKEQSGMTKEPHKPTRGYVVDAILVLYGQPRLHTGATLAHEMMHAWLRLNGYGDLRPEVEEGICEVVAHMWLESELMALPGSNAASTLSSWSSWPSLEKFSRSQLERKLGAFYKHRVETNTSTIYGDGFRAGKIAVLQHGLKNTLDHIKQTGNFPCFVKQAVQD